ncbi:MAG TPA: class I SAM-dependent methyltransferase, partial [Candidatus Hodarchaeales archaeon]|nr:class I SAM-dependent methyltransferase [Candidatus Hodarchaeales archaeon]
MSSQVTFEKTFTKYQTQGAYHWSRTYNECLQRYSPRMHALYDVPFRLLRQYHGLGDQKIGLDIGCGDGVTLYKAMLAGGRIIGVDIEYSGLALARKQIENRMKQTPKLVNSSCYHLPFPDQSFDYVLSVEVIEHLAKPDQFLSEIRRVLRPGGIIVLTTPQRVSLYRTERGIPQDPFHIHEYTGPELVTLLSEYFPEVSVWGMFPAPLDRLYFHATHIGILDKLVRGVFKLVAKWLFNPYALAITRSPNSRWSNLVAVCAT